MTTKYLNDTGLAYFFGKLKALFATKDVATQSTDGLLSASDKTKLDGLDQLVDSGSGTSITVTADTCIESIIVHGKSVQNGTPTTSSPVEIKSVEDQNLIKLLKSDIKSYNTSGTWSGNVYSYRGITATLNDDGTITIDGTATGNFNFYLLPSNHQIIVPVDSYKITGGISGGSDSSYYLQVTSTTNASGTVQARNRDYGSGNVFSTNSSTYGLACYFHASTGNSFDNDILSPCIMKADIAVPIHNIGLVINASIVPVNISNEIGSSILDGTCNDFLIDSVGRVTMIKRIKKKILDESITWSTYSAWDGNGEYCLYNKFNDADKNSIPLCSCLTGYSKSDFSGSSKPIESCTFDGGKNFCVRVPYSTSDNFKTWLASNNQVVFYKLETPEIVDLGYIDIPEISNNSVVSINSLVTPNMQVQWWTEYALPISNAVQSLKTLMLQ